MTGDKLTLDELVERVAQLLADGTITLFLGAGVSVGTDKEKAEGKGAPSTDDLKLAIA